MVTTFSPLESNENYLLELIDNLLQDGYKNPLRSKLSVVHKITNNSANLSLDDAKFINKHSDSSKFEEYIQKELDEDSSGDYANCICNALRNEFADISYKNAAPYCAEAFLNSIKERISKKETHTKQIDKIPDEDIYSKISFVVKNINKNSTETELVKLSYNPLKVKEKLKDNYALFSKVNNFVVDFYEFVDLMIKEQQNDPKFIFEAVSKKIKKRFVMNDKKPLSECFDYLVNWLQSETDGTREACEIVISYFIQSCEVFYATSK